jgi:hypothetical protein
MGKILADASERYHHRLLSWHGGVIRFQWIVGTHWDVVRPSRVHNAGNDHCHNCPPTNDSIGSSREKIKLTDYRNEIPNNAQTISLTPPLHTYYTLPLRPLIENRIAATT